MKDSVVIHRACGQQVYPTGRPDEYRCPCPDCKGRIINYLSDEGRRDLIWHYEPDLNDPHMLWR